MLRLSREADYGLLAMIYIASRPPGQLAYRRDIASHYSIPKEFLAKVLQKLTRRGLIKSFRGIQGGYLIARDPAEISMAEVIEAVDGPMAIVECQGDAHDCLQEVACTVKTTMAEVKGTIRRVLEGITLHDMLARLRPEDRQRLIALEAGSR